MTEQTFQVVTDVPLDGPWAVFRREPGDPNWHFVSQHITQAEAEFAAQAVVGGGGSVSAQILAPSGNRYTSV